MTIDYTPGALSVWPTLDRGDQIIIETDPNIKRETAHRVLCTMEQGQHGCHTAEDMANARRFVLCWNSHDDLLAALEDLAVTAAVINNREPVGKEPDSRTPEHWDSFREAINKAYATITKTKGTPK